MIDGPRMLDEFREAATQVGLLGEAVLLSHETCRHLTVHRCAATSGEHCRLRVLLECRLRDDLPSWTESGAQGGEGRRRRLRPLLLPALPSGLGESEFSHHLLAEGVLWPYLGIEQLDQAGIKAWMCKYLDRDHIFVAGQPGLEREIERYFHGRLGPVFEGRSYAAFVAAPKGKSEFGVALCSPDAITRLSPSRNWQRATFVSEQEAFA